MCGAERDQPDCVIRAKSPSGIKSSSLPSHDFLAMPELSPLTAHTSVCTARVRRMMGSDAAITEDVLANEVAVALVYNGLSHAVMMCSPLDLEDFALGFSLSEGILAQPSELYSVEVTEHAQGIELHLDIATARFVRLKERRRQITGRTGCGLCGVESLEQAITPLAHVAAQRPIAFEAIYRALEAMPALQTLARATGCTHAAAWCSREGEITLLREDIGRHVALDKLIGARAKIAPEEGFALISSRASYEMVHKAAQVGIQTLVAISAPSALAVSLAQEAGITLMGFARGNKVVVYDQSVV